jgi:DNA-binding NarL/FixJ family response regulator
MKKQTERNGQPHRELSEQQRAAVELLAAGKTDKEAAKALNLPGDMTPGANPGRLRCVNSN